MDVSLPIGAAMVAGTPPAGGVPDVLARLAGSDGAVASDAFAEMLATLGLDATDGSVAADDQIDADADATPEAAAAALAAGALGLLSQPAVPPVVVATGAAGAETAAVPSSPAEPAGGAAGSTAPPSTNPATDAPASPTEIARDAGILAETAEAVRAAPPRPPRRALGSDAAASAPAKEPAPSGSTERSVAAVTEAAAVTPASAHDAARAQDNAKVEPPVRAHEPSPRPQDAAVPEVAPEQAKTRADAVALTIGEPSALPRRREQAPTQPEPASGARHASGAESLTNAPRPATAGAPSTPRSEASTAYRYAEAATLPETNRPLGRLPDGGEMRLEVSPEGLGPIEIRVAVRADAVQASLWTQQDHARAALEAHRPMLADALGRSSLRLEEFTVGVGQHHHAAQDDDRTPRRWANPAAAEPVAAPTTTHAPVRPRGLSLRA